MSSEARSRESICALGAKLAARGLCPGTSGNISVRIADGWLMTPTNSSLGELDPAQLSRLDANGKHVGGDAPTKEALLHRSVYDVRPKDGAIVHLHSTHSVAVSVLDDIDQATAVLASQSAAAHAFIAAEVAEELSTKLDKLISYDGTNPRAVAVLARRRLELSTELVETQRQAIGETLRLGLENGWNPRQTAVAIRDSIGLTVPQTQWVANYRRKLENASRGALDNALRDARSDRAVARAAATGTPLPQARIDKLVERYAERQLNYRAEVIAREETLRSLEAAQDEAFQQVIDAGQLDADRVQLEWHQRSRPNMRDIHRPMDGQSRRFGEAFVSGAGNLLRFPHDPDAPLSESEIETLVAWIEAGAPTE